MSSLSIKKSSQPNLDTTIHSRLEIHQFGVESLLDPAIKESFASLPARDQKVALGSASITAGVVIARTAWLASSVEAVVVMAGGLAGLLLGLGGLVIAEGIGGKDENTTESNNTSFHLIDPERLNLNRDDSTSVNSGYKLLSGDDRSAGFHLTNSYLGTDASFKETMNSFKEATDALKGDHDSHMGELSEGGPRETGNDHLTENRSEY